MQTIDEIRKELEELETKMQKISKIIINGEIKELGEQEKEYLYKQKGFMEAYKDILEKRINYYICVETAKEITLELIKQEEDKYKGRKND
jgi:hypothetical protein